MRMSGYLVLMFLAILGTNPAQSQDRTTVLRAGEHADFTRLVMPLADGTDWRLDAGDGFVDLRFEGAKVTFDLSETFDRIPRTRLQDVEALNDGIRLRLACPCPVKPVAGFIGQLVLDIQNPVPDPAPGGAPLRPMARPATQIAPTISRQAGIALAQMMRGQNDPLPPLALAPSQIFQPAWGAPADASLSVDLAQDLTKSLSAAIAGAVAGDLLTPADKLSESTGAQPERLPVSAVGHILSQRDPRDPPSGAPQQNCSAAVSSWIADWSTPPPGEADISDWSLLFDPLDQIDTAVGTRLLVQQLRLGFGAEARSLLSLLPDIQHAETLHNFTYVLDLEVPPNPDFLQGFASCSDMDTLWAFLGNPSATLGVDTAQNRLVRAMQTLPEPLRQHFGSAVLQGLLRHAAIDTANLIQTILTRSGDTAQKGSVTPDMLLAKPDAVAELTPLKMLDLSDNDLLLLMQNAQDRDQVLPPDVLRLAIDRQFALRRSPVGRSLALVTARALALAQEYDPAFRIANAPESDLTPEAREGLVSDLFDILTRTASDTSFVTTVFAQQPWQTTGLVSQTRQAIGARLQALGFAEASSRMQAPTVSQDHDAALERGDTLRTPAQTVSQMSPVTPTTPDRPRAETLAAMATPRTETDGFAPPQSVTAPPGLLAQGRQALENAQALRAQLQTLIAAPDTGPQP